jgi:hypothetical protein
VSEIQRIFNVSSAHPNSLANLRPFKPGMSGNPSGRPRNAGLSVLEWVNILAKVDHSTLMRVKRNRRAPWNKRAAATWMLRALSHGDLDDLMDLIAGRIW